MNVSHEPSGILYSCCYLTYQGQPRLYHGLGTRLHAGIQPCPGPRPPYVFSSRGSPSPRTQPKVLVLSPAHVLSPRRNSVHPRYHSTPGTEPIQVPGAHQVLRPSRYSAHPGTQPTQVCRQPKVLKLTRYSLQ
jgi:hypothetical protein